MLKRIGTWATALMLAATGAFLATGTAHADSGSSKGRHVTSTAATARTGVRPLTTCSPTCFYYAGGYQYTTGSPAPSGVIVSMGVVKPTISTANGDKHSLIELAVEDATGQNLVEGGYTVDPSLNGGSTNPFMFVFRWINGVPQGYNAAGGFTKCQTGVTPACTTPTIGAGQDASAWIGTNKTMDIEYFSGFWWVTANGQKIGYYNAADWVSPTFTSVGLQQAFGEVVSNRDYAAGNAPCAQMGTGIQPPSTSAAGVGSLTYVGGTTTAAYTAFSGPYPNYTAALISPSVRSLRYGGDNTAC